MNNPKRNKIGVNLPEKIRIFNEHDLHFVKNGEWWWIELIELNLAMNRGSNYHERYEKYLNADRSPKPEKIDTYCFNDLSHHGSGRRVIRLDRVRQYISVINIDEKTRIRLFELFHNVEYGKEPRRKIPKVEKEQLEFNRVEEIAENSKTLKDLLPPKKTFKNSYKKNYTRICLNLLNEAKQHGEFAMLNGKLDRITLRNGKERIDYILHSESLILYEDGVGRSYPRYIFCKAFVDELKEKGFGYLLEGVE